LSAAEKKLLKISSASAKEATKKARIYGVEFDLVVTGVRRKPKKPTSCGNDAQRCTHPNRTFFGKVISTTSASID